MFRVYLAGTISAEARHLKWRDTVRSRLQNLVTNWVGPHEPATIQCIDPLRFQDPKNFSKNGLHDDTCPDQLFVATDVNDVIACDAVLVVFWTNKRQSVGTWAELGIAGLLHKPIVLVTNDPDVADHPFVHRYAAYVTDNLHDACNRLAKIAR